MKIFFIVGEDSGDALAAPLIRSLQQSFDGPIKCTGVGGPLMSAEEGFETLFSMERISVVGIWEIIPKLPNLLKAKKDIIEEIEYQQPDIVITVDFPDFNFNLVKSLKKRRKYKGKAIHYVAPSVWAWRPGRAKKIAQIFDGIMCLFPMEPQYFTTHGLSAKYVGHPIVTSNAKTAKGAYFRKKYNIDDGTKTIGLFFGSRKSEFKNLGSVIKNAALIITDTRKNIKIIAPTLPHLEKNVQEIIEGSGLNVDITCDPAIKWESIKACDFAIAVCGTVALEIAYAGIPHIVCYKVNPVTAFIIKMLLKIKNVHLANILLNKEIVPEMLQGLCTSKDIAQKAIDILNDSSLRDKQIKAFAELDEKLGLKEDNFPSQKAANFILEKTKQ